MAWVEPTAGQPLGESFDDLLRPFSGFAEQALATLAILREQFAFERWTIGRLVDDRLVVEFVDPSVEPLTVGSSFPWSETICARMVDGEGPCVAPSIAAVPIYAATPQCRQLGLGAYAGVPLYDREGLLWGTLCGTHPTALPAEPQVDEAFLRWIARSLTTHLVSPTSPCTVQERNRRPGPSTILDTHMWSTLLEKEHERSARTGQPACVIELDVASAVAKAAVRRRRGRAHRPGGPARGRIRPGCDFVARTGTTRVCVLAVNCPEEGARGLAQRLVAELEEGGINARAAIVELLPRAEALCPKKPWNHRRRSPTSSAGNATAEVPTSHRGSRCSAASTAACAIH